MKSLSELKIGSRGIVIDVIAKGDRKIRINEMGITRGAEIAINSKAPLGDPIEIEVRGYRLCIRKKDARGIIVDCLENA